MRYNFDINQKVLYHYAIECVKRIVLSQRQCQQKRKASLKTWQKLTSCAMRGKWRITFPPRARRRSGSRTPMPQRDHRMYNKNHLYNVSPTKTLGAMQNTLSPQVCILPILCWIPPEGKKRDSRTLNWRHGQEVGRAVEPQICRGQAAIWEEGGQAEGEVRQGKPTESKSENYKFL